MSRFAENAESGALETGYQDLLESGALAIADAATKFRSVLETHRKALVSISGGADSDVMLDMCERVRGGTGCDVTYAFIDTGIEYEATKRHVEWLEARYGVTIKRCRADKTIPVSCKEHGSPFLSKYISDCVWRLQQAGFRWEDEPLEVLEARYPNTRKALRWWCDDYSRTDEPGYYDIGSMPFLKEFMMENPPWFPISDKCCHHAKKRVSERVVSESGCDVRILGLRRSEGGIRAKRGGGCFRVGKPDSYFPLFWMSDADRRLYEERFGIRHSACYRQWGFRRTGCVGCPFNRNAERDLDIAQAFEPGVVSVARMVFADSYEYTKQYREFRRRSKVAGTGQLELF